MNSCAASSEAGALTGRQREVLDLIVQGRSNKEIACTLKIAEGTVKIHVAALFSKLGINRRSAAAVAGACLIVEASKRSQSAEWPSASSVVQVWVTRRASPRAGRRRDLQVV
jgi:DNA-binding CsgD family transcriptional regulator